MKISNLLFGANIKIPEYHEDGTYELADYTLGCLNNFDVGTAGLIRKDIHSLCWFGDSVEYAGSDLDKRMTEIYNSSGAENITRKVFAPTLTMVGCGDNHEGEEGLVWPIFTGRNSRKKTFNGSDAAWRLSSQYSSYLAWFVYSDGSAYNLSPSFTSGVVPAFVIPQSVQIDDAPDNDGSYRLTELTAYYNVIASGVKPLASAMGI